MEFNSLVNRLLQEDPAGRRRNLKLRTYVPVILVIFVIFRAVVRCQRIEDSMEYVGVMFRAMASAYTAGCCHILYLVVH